MTILQHHYLQEILIVYSFESGFITIFAGIKTGHIVNTIMKEVASVSNLVKTYRRLFHCLMFYD